MKGVKLNGTLYKRNGEDFTTDDFFELMDSLGLQYQGEYGPSFRKRIRYFEGCLFIGTTEGICDDEPMVIGTREKVVNVLNYKTIKDAMFFLSLTEEQVKECYAFLKNEII